VETVTQVGSEDLAKVVVKCGFGDWAGRAKTEQRLHSLWQILQAAFGTDIACQITKATLIVGRTGAAGPCWIFRDVGPFRAL